MSHNRKRLNIDIIYCDAYIGLRIKAYVRVYVYVP